MNDIAVVICNYNKKNYVLSCIESVLNSSFRGFDLIVVDNASTDGSVEAIQSQYADRLTILENEENTGGSGGFHRGMKHAVDAGYKYVLCLDNDVEFDKNAIGALYRFMESRPEAGACGSAIYRFDDRSCTQEMGAMIDYKNLGFKLLHAQMRNAKPPEETECDYIAFCSAMLRVDALKRVGLMQHEYFIYWDDIELCWRIRRGGYKIFAISGSVVYHHANPIDPTTTFSHYYMFRNKLNCFARHLDDHAFDELPELVTQRLYRIFAVNRNNLPVITTYMHALNDALNGIAGKAGEGRILPFESNASIFTKSFAGVKTVLVRHGGKNDHLRNMIVYMKKISGCDIKVAVGAEDWAVIKDMEGIVAANEQDTFERTIHTFPHILDIPEYEQGVIYLDDYWNFILSDEDLQYIKTFSEGYDFFHKTHYEFIRAKLSELRKSQRILY